MSMPLEQLNAQEQQNTGTAWTRNDIFEKNGCLVIRNLWDPEELFRPVQVGQVNYYGKRLDQYMHEPEENQVNGSLASYSHPQYRQIHSVLDVNLNL